MSQARIYLDHAATTPLRPEARAAMEPFLSPASFGNASSLHWDGQQAKRALDSARDTLAQALGAQSSEISFTSGGTEADNAALVGVMLAGRARGSHLVTTQMEHEAVLHAARFLETLGFDVTYLAPNSEGTVSPEQVKGAMRPGTILVSVMHASNEVGTIQDIRAIAEVAHAGGALLHTDAVQTFGQCAVNVQSLGADLVTVSAHKIYGPKGAGALYVKEGIAMEPLLHGGGQERGRRAGTENVAAIAGFAQAVRCLLAEREETAARMTSLRDSLIASLRKCIPQTVLNGHASNRLPNNVNVSLVGNDAETLLLALDMAGVSASSGSACTAGSIEPSHVLLSMGLDERRTQSALRLSLGRSTTRAETERVVEILAGIVRKA